MGVVHSGGLMGAGIKDSSEMEFKVDLGFSSGKEAIKNMKDRGTMGCLMAKGFSSLRTGKNTKVLSKKTNFMEMESSIKTIR